MVNDGGNCHQLMSVIVDRLKSSYGEDFFNLAVFGSLGTIAAGISINDSHQLSRDLVQTLSTSALNNLPLEQTEYLIINYLSALNTEQLTAVKDSPRYEFFSRQVKNLIDAALDIRSFSILFADDASRGSTPLISSTLFFSSLLVLFQFYY